MPLVAGNDMTIPIARWVKFWSVYVHDGSSTCPYGATQGHTISWFMCVLIADACDLGSLFPTSVVRRPQSDDAEWNDAGSAMQHFSYACCVAMVRTVLQRMGHDASSMVAALDMQAHWPTSLQDRVAADVNALRIPHVTADQQEWLQVDGFFASMISTVCNNYALRMQGKNYLHAAAALERVCTAAGADELAEDQCPICQHDMVHDWIRLRCACRLKLHRQCFVTYLAHHSRAATFPLCLVCRNCIGCLYGAPIVCPTHPQQPPPQNGRVNTDEPMPDPAVDGDGAGVGDVADDADDPMPDRATDGDSSAFSDIADDESDNNDQLAGMHQDGANDVVAPAAAGIAHPTAADDHANEGLYAAAERAVAAGHGIDIVRAHLLLLTTIPSRGYHPTPEIEAAMRRFYRLWDRAHREWDGNMRTYR